MLQLPKVIGHRGAAAYSPENTLESFREARRRGATWVETDIKLTADGVPIVMHDDSLKRTTGVDRLVAKTPRAELPAGVPTFEEAIACFGEEGLGCNVEIKPCPGREAETGRVVVETLRRCWPAHLPAPLLSSFKDESRAAARRRGAGIRARPAARQVRRGLAGAASTRWRCGGRQHQRRETHGAAGPAPSRMPAWCWASTPSTIREVARVLVGMGVDVVITDAPDVILAALVRLERRSGRQRPEAAPKFGLRSSHSLGGLSSDCNKTDTSQSWHPSIHRRGLREV